MNITKTFGKALKAIGDNRAVWIVTDYTRAKKLVKLFCGLPETDIQFIALEDELMDGYYGLFTLAYCKDGEFSCEKAELSSGKIGRIGVEGDLVLFDRNCIPDDKVKDYLTSDSVQYKFV